MTTTTYRYSGPSFTAVREGVCTMCEHPTRRQRTFSGTVNPFNRNADGSPRTWEQVAASVRAEADAWQPDPRSDMFRHDSCIVRAATEAIPAAEPAPRDERRVDTRGRVLTGTAAAVAVLAKHQLYAANLEVRASGWGPDRDVPEVEVLLFSDSSAGEFARWLTELPFTDLVEVERRTDSTYLRARCHHAGVVWRVSSLLRRQGAAEHLPGVEVDWKYRGKRRLDRGTLPVAQVLIALHNLGVPQVLV